MKNPLFFLMCLFTFAINAQNQTSKTVTVDSPGWKRVAKLDGGAGRGYNKITLMTKGGATTPRVATISWFKGWSNYGGLNLTSISDNGHWYDARITYDSTSSYLEVNFTINIPLLDVHLDSSAWTGGTLFEGTLPNGEGSVLLTAKFGRLNFGENDLLMDYKGNLGLGVSAPNAQVVVGNNFGATISGSSGGNAVFGTNLAIQNGGTNHNQLFTPYSHTNSYGYAGVKASWGHLYFYANRENTTSGQTITPATRMIIYNNGNVGIGTTNTQGYKLAVAGKVVAEEIKVALQNSWPDYVFEDTYALPTLQEVENHIHQKGHLINIPSAAEVEEDGIQLGEMNAKLLEKIEELTLYTIAQEKEIYKLQSKNDQQASINKQLQTTNKNLEARLARIEALLEK